MSHWLEDLGLYSSLRGGTSNWFGDSMFPTLHLGLPRSGHVCVVELGLSCGSLVLSLQQAGG